jgi:hypothetical protein
MFCSFVFLSIILRGARYTTYLALSWPNFIEQRSETKTTLATPKPATLDLKKEALFQKLCGMIPMRLSVP